MPPIALSTGEQRVLESLTDLHYATNRQITRYGWSPTSYEYVCRKTRSLVAAGLLAEDFERRKFATGRSASTFFLSPKAIRDYAQRGYILPQLSPVREHMQAHYLGVADLILLVRAYARESGATIDRLIHDVVLKTAPIPLAVAGVRRLFVPDLWCELTIGGKPWRISFELDRDTEAERKWREKVRLLLAFAGQGLARFNVDTVTFAIVVVPEDRRRGERRVAELLRWTEAELRERRQEAWGQLFLFRAADPATDDPAALCTAPRWVSPFAPDPVRLIET